MAVVTNIDADHMDIYDHSLENLSRLLSIFASAAILWPCRTCGRRQCAQHPAAGEAPVTTYGFAADAQVRAENVVPDGQCMRFDAVW